MKTVSSISKLTVKSVIPILFFCFAFGHSSAQDTTHVDENEIILEVGDSESEEVLRKASEEERSKERKNRRSGKDDSDEEGMSFSERLTFGGDFSLNLGNTNTFILVAPTVGIRPNENSVVGLGLNYLYVNQLGVVVNTGQTFRQQGSLYGGRVFTQQFLYNDFFVRAEFESLNREITNRRDLTRERVWVPGAWIGGGSLIPISAGSRRGLQLTAMYNLLHDPNRSPYASPFQIRGGLQF